jgi:hypothetical protein
MADPVSWLMIEPGWRVDAADGAAVGRVEEVTGDSNADIFDGLAISFDALGRQHYVPAEQVGAITQGVVELQLTEAQIAKLGEFEEPAEEIDIEPDKASVGTRARQWERRPGYTPHQTHLLRRILEWLGLAGRR